MYLAWDEERVRPPLPADLGFCRAGARARPLRTIPTPPDVRATGRNRAALNDVPASAMSA
jgi:hypothetical protein